MPPKAKATMPKTKCIKFGEILIDENKKILLLCVNCFLDFNSVSEFCKHLKDCEMAKHVFQSTKTGAKLVCDTSGNLLTNVVQKSRELIIYDVKEKSICDIEAEILNPRWYKDTAPSSPIRTAPNKNTKTYNNLIEEVTPFVQFKENLRTSTPKHNSNSAAAVKTEPKILQSKVTTNAAAAAAATIAQKKQAASATVKPNAIKADKVPIPISLMSTKNCQVNPTLKRKATTIISNQANDSSTSHLSIQTAVKRERHSDESKAPPQPAARAITTYPKTCLNKPNVGNMKTQTQTFKIQTQQPNHVDQHAAMQLPKILPSNAASLQRLTRKPRSLIKQPVSPQPLNGTRTAPPQLPATAATSAKSTVDILNKLQTLGLKVKRTNPAPPISAPAVSQERNAALEIIKKLQSKGMEIKRVPK